MPHTFYINSVTGKDANAGTSSSTAFKSIAALDHVTLQPGDTVLLARGTTYSDQLTIKNSGTAGAPITFGAYGTGAAPVISGPATGIYSSGTHDVVVHGIAIAHTSGYAIIGLNLSNWTVDGVSVSSTGSSTHAGSISFQNSSNIAVKNSTLSGITGDGMLINGGHGITVSGNKVSTVQGHDADNLQVVGASHVTITGNTLDMSGATTSTKGNLVVNTSDTVDIEHNTLVGGHYGASVNSNNVIIASNEIHGQKGYDWSFGIGLAENWNLKNYNIHDNTIHNVPFGVAITGDSTSVWRQNIDVHNNTFDHIGDAALKVDRNASGEFVNNRIGSDSQATQITNWIAVDGKFTVSGNTSFSDSAPLAKTDIAPLSAEQTHVSGDVLSNDTSASSGALSVSQIDGKAVGTGVDVTGKYGTVSIDAHGNFVFSVDSKAVAGLDHQVSDQFSYLVTDGHSQSVAQLKISVAPGDHNGGLLAVNDTAIVGSNGTATGDALANDQHNAGETLLLRSIAGATLDSAPVEVAGHYGTLSIAANGDFTYSADASKVGSSDTTLHDTFMYKVSDGAAQDAASLGFAIDPHAISVQASSDFHI
ncbi:MAG TPA: right-handed parallel beta-helix repeat-containing protein [Arsenicitalea sp.]|jgi:polysaccharidase protein|nr:right-handed parallel beta-helix repeat-containing protein [Arsenicitalea sp.]